VGGDHAQSHDQDQLSGSEQHLRELTALCGFADSEGFQAEQRQWVEQTLERGRTLRDDRWSESIAVGSLAFVEGIKRDLGSTGDRGQDCVLRYLVLRSSGAAQTWVSFPWGVRSLLLVCPDELLS
jgi:hypothetical protein